jgi:hypothetical protein
MWTGFLGFFFRKKTLNCLSVKGKVLPLHADYYQRNLDEGPVMRVDSCPIGLGSGP